MLRDNTHKFGIGCAWLCASKGPKYDIFSLKIIIRRIFIIKVSIADLCAQHLFF